MSGDLISRSEVLEKLADVIREMPIPAELYEDGILGGLGTAFSMIENAPAVDAEPIVHAHWFTNEDSQGWFRGIVYCSACKQGDSTVRAPRCRYCGAHMDEIRKVGYCPICDKEVESYEEGSMTRCPTCNHDIVLHEEDGE